MDNADEGLIGEPHWSNCPARDGGRCTCRRYGVPPSALKHHDQDVPECICYDSNLPARPDCPYCYPKS
jgi:hypothetical protein